MIEIYKQPKFKKLDLAALIVSVPLLGYGLSLLLFQQLDPINLSLFIFYPAIFLIYFYFNRNYPYITLTDNCLTKRLFFKQYKIHLDEIEYIKNVFGDIQVKGPDKIIQIEKDVVKSEDLQRLVDELKSRTALKLV